eukprot:CAMPEP_0170539814 /NCGR_PEP_ID=MMETSP0209-20121228/104226_1 /TAXON_ID=665100 ORGANISM="Litonotus pictus, Strain P1" /NCGR_SAMPLE_ID=MMETSP0209 /ASSEMBLY_ACC=CAM_ASM_000301 /LENGTH=160 /DNA_ID=CAMNT_0010841957 /DNA_START=1256 /DNA_END=1735 /DNA_ORIENTATION=-
MENELSSNHLFDNDMAEYYDSSQFQLNEGLGLMKAESIIQFESTSLKNFISQNKPLNVGLVSEIDEELIQNNIKTMDLLDEKFKYFNQKGTINQDQMDNKDYSDPIILAKDILIFSDSKKRYSNEYTVEMAKKELFDLIDENSFNSLIKTSNIHKDPTEW